MNLQDKLTQLLQQTELQLSPDQITQLVQLVEQLHKWNKAYNLTSVRDPQVMLSRHIMDSLAVMPYLEGQRFIDVGTGPGLPGLPLAIVKPECEFVLLDSLGKRVRFIRQVCHQLGLTNVTAVQSRVEDYLPAAASEAEKFDGVISRAFASLNDMLSWCHHLPRAEGRFYALKGQYPSTEIAQLPATYEVVKVDALQVPDVDGERHLVTIRTRG